MVSLLADADTVSPSFTPDRVGSYIVQLIVDDSALASDPDTVTITVENRAPTADAGPDRTVAVNELAILDGSASSDPDTDPLTFQWNAGRMLLPAAWRRSREADTASPSLTPDLAGAVSSGARRQ